MSDYDPSARIILSSLEVAAKRSSENCRKLAGIVQAIQLLSHETASKLDASLRDLTLLESRCTDLRRELSRIVNPEENSSTSQPYPTIGVQLPETSSTDGILDHLTARASTKPTPAAAQGVDSSTVVRRVLTDLGSKALSTRGGKQSGKRSLQEATKRLQKRIAESKQRRKRYWELTSAERQAVQARLERKRKSTGTTATARRPRSR